MVRWYRKQMAGFKPWHLDSKTLLTTATSHYPQHQFTALIVDGIYKDYFLIPFCCLELDALLCKQLTYASILCAMQGRKQVFSEQAPFLTWNNHDWVPIPLTPAFPLQPTHPWATYCPLHYHWFPSADAAGDWNLSAWLDDIKFINEVPFLTIIVQSNKTPILVVTHADTLFPLQRSVGWLPGKYNYVLAWE